MTTDHQGNHAIDFLNNQRDTAQESGSWDFYATQKETIVDMVESSKAIKTFEEISA